MRSQWIDDAALLSRSHQWTGGLFGTGLGYPGESGFGHCNPKTLNLGKEQIPTITVVDDTFEKYRDVMAEIIQKAKSA